MVSELETRARSAPQKVDVTALLQKQDEQYEGYLHLLHEYTEAKANLAKQMSNGFLSLAQANYTTQNRIRYGRDHYDERMQALKTVHVTEVGEHAHTFQIQDVQEDATEEAEDQAETKDEVDEPSKEVDEEESDVDKAAPKKQTQDPLRWFGILVPQALRTSQEHFSVAAKLIVNEIASLDSQMKALEIKMRRTKRQIDKSGR